MRGLTKGLWEVRTIMPRILLAALVLVLSATGFASARAASANTNPAVAVRVLPEYTLGPGDKLRVIVFNEAALTGEFLVSANGVIAFPLIGEVKSQGKTVEQVRSAIESLLKDGYLKDPRVSIEILSYRPFYILGEVTKPGEYPYISGLTVPNAVATAGGFTYRADKKRVYIKRADGSTEEQFPLTTGTQVAPGDTIRIGERFF